MDLGQNLQNFTKSDIFTPDNIAKMMSSYLSHKGSLLEPCVGTGNLLKYIDVDKSNAVGYKSIVVKLSGFAKFELDTKITREQFHQLVDGMCRKQGEGE